MTQKVQVTRVSDLDGTEGAETVRFGLDGTEYEIDLSAPEIGQMRAGLAGFIAHARKKDTRRKRTGQRKPSRDDLPDIRAYALARGYDIKGRGAVPGRIVEEYDRLKGYSLLK